MSLFSFEKNFEGNFFARIKFGFIHIIFHEETKKNTIYGNFANWFPSIKICEENFFENEYCFPFTVFFEEKFCRKEKIVFFFSIF